MLPVTVPASHCDAAHPDAGRRVSPALLALDEHLFNPDERVAEVADWLRRRDCWVLERPSGGAKGRWHIFFAHRDFHYSPAASRTGFAAAVSEFLSALADDVKVPRGELDLRDAVRRRARGCRGGIQISPRR